MFIQNKNEPLIIFENFIEDNTILNNAMTYFQNNIQWSQDEYILYAKKVLSPRLTSSHGIYSYSYSGQTKHVNDYNQGISYLQTQIEEFLNLNNYFNGYLLNYYRNGNDSISYHKDNEKDMVPETIIAVISLESDRKFYLKNDNTAEIIKFILPPGSLAIMNPICQKLYKHSIPKEKKVSEPRISLTFRKFN